jgi:hypothetical protein
MRSTTRSGAPIVTVTTAAKKCAAVTSICCGDPASVKLPSSVVTASVRPARSLTVADATGVPCASTTVPRTAVCA